MDFPLQLISTGAKLNTPVGTDSGSNLEFVYGEDELRQDIYLLLKTIKGRFLQRVDLGTLAVPHTVSEQYLHPAVARCVEQISGLQCDSVSVDDERLYVRCNYQGNVQEFSFSIASL